MSALRNKSILVGVTGSIAAYKAAEIVRLLRKKEATVYPIMTKTATHFLSPLLFKIFKNLLPYIADISLSRLV